MTPAGGARTNRYMVLAARPTGVPSESDFRLETGPVPAPGDGQILVRNAFMSVDPYMRGRMIDRKPYAPPWQIGQPLEGGAVGRVIASRHPRFAEGDWVQSRLGWREYAVSDGQGVQKIDAALGPPASYLGVLGIPGFTGWYGLKEIGKPKAGETVVVSGAAGATGSLVGQVGKILGCRVVGTAGSEEKCAYLVGTLGFDAAINYRTAGDLHEALRAACPHGIDVYFENVGGPILDAVLQLINPFARIPLCGMISQYNLATPEPGPRYLMSMVGNRALMQGFIISDHLDRYPEFVREVGGWLTMGRITHEQTVVDGIENAPRAFLGLFKGDNLGKMVVKLDPSAS
ncbi:MAG: NADP-dependent oxidoreductase [Candidatus Rokubacteria bacterium]|nr:NADP-dependent oxidoreductase [Candidatus Rokubacteria bacterium]